MQLEVTEAPDVLRQQLRDTVERATDYDLRLIAKAITEASQAEEARRRAILIPKQLRPLSDQELAAELKRRGETPQVYVGSEEAHARLIDELSREKV